MTRLPSWKGAAPWLLVLILTVILVGLFQRSTGADVAEQARVEALVHEIVALDARLNQDLLKLRHRQLQDYDAVAAADERISALLQRLQAELQRHGSEAMTPVLALWQEKREGLDVIRITVAGGLEKPYYLKKYGMTEKGCFLRVGSASEPMTQEMIDSLYSRRVRNTIGRMESTRLNLTFEQIKIYYEARGLRLNEAFMQNLELLTPEGKPNYAAYLLADENGVSIQVAKYADTTRVNLIENRDFGRCSLVKALKGVLERMDVENTIYTKIGYPLREEREMIHGRAMREAVINAVVHNDYSNGASPKFEFFCDDFPFT